MELFPRTFQEGAASTEDALKIFDQLQAPDMEFMLGFWKGSGFPTNHFLDGLLEASGWYGKAFKGPEQVHPLLFYKANKAGIFAVNPGLLPLKLLRLPLPKNQLMRKSLVMVKFFLQTSNFKARMRMMEYRGTIAPAMIYDDQPIIDIFRKMDDQTLLGLMDMKGMQQPFFFILERDDTFGF